jgi:hypothetical protein
MAVAYFTTWSMFNERNGAKSDVAPTEEGTYIRELGGAEKFLSRKIPGTDKVSRGQSSNRYIPTWS